MQVKTIQDVKNLGSILGIWAHPDDETFMSAGIMAVAVKNGQQVVCVTATNGEQGVQNEDKWPSSQLSLIRRQELKNALNCLGVSKHHCLNFKDGHCSTEDAPNAVKCIREYIDKYQPDSILTFGSDGMTGHPDHKAVCSWTSEACQKLGLGIELYYAVQPKDLYEHFVKDLDAKFNIFFNVDRPKIAQRTECDIYFELDNATKFAKYTALKAMPSQTEHLLSTVGKEYLMDALGVEAFIKAK